MFNTQLYRYIGRNGTITSPIKLENIEPISMIKLQAEKGKILTDGNKKVYSVIIFEDEISNWEEIADIGQE